MSHPREKRTEIFLIALLTVFILVGCTATASPVATEPAEPAPTEKALERLKGGLAEVATAFQQQGLTAAAAVAAQREIVLQESAVRVVIYTTGSSGEEHLALVKALGIEQAQASALSNVIEANVPLDKLVELARQDYVRFITLPPVPANP